MGFVWFSLQIAIISLSSVNQLIFVMERFGVFFALRTEFLQFPETVGFCPELTRLVARHGFVESSRRKFSNII
jgi:hypothetical protein